MSDALCPVCAGRGCAVCFESGTIRQDIVDRARQQWDPREDPKYRELVRLEHVLFHRPMFTALDEHDERLDFRVVAEWDGVWWVVRIPLCGWSTLTRDRGDVERVAEQLISSVTELPPAAFDMEVEYTN